MRRAVYLDQIFRSRNRENSADVVLFIVLRYSAIPVQYCLPGR